jgi:putative mRNA 3-end processing factor
LFPLAEFKMTSGDIAFQFLGGVDEVGSLAMNLKMDELHVLFEYGMSPGKPPGYPLEAPLVDITMLTHAHLDHSGMIPLLCSQQDTMIMGTELTRKISNLLHKDTLKIAKMDGYAIPYDMNDVKNADESYIEIAERGMKHIGDGHEVHFHPAGHIPGSIMYELRGSKKILFSGDINVINTRLMKGLKPVNCDVLFLESTYAGREHPPRDELEKRFLDTIDEVVTRGGVAVIPAFAVSRSQELALVLRKSGFNVWFDGMGRKVSKIFLQHPKSLRNPEELKKAINKLNFVHSDHGRKLALESEVIITSSGMLEGGPILWYMKHLKNNKKSAVLLTGYQVAGTNGRLLLDKHKLDFYGVTEDIECQVYSFDFSAHAGHSELIDFARKCEPETIVLYHSDNREPLVQPLSEFADVLTPVKGERVTI